MSSLLAIEFCGTNGSPPEIIELILAQVVLFQMKQHEQTFSPSFISSGLSFCRNRHGP